MPESTISTELTSRTPLLKIQELSASKNALLTDILSFSQPLKSDTINTIMCKFITKVGCHQTLDSSCIIKTD